MRGGTLEEFYFKSDWLEFRSRFFRILFFLPADKPAVQVEEKPVAAEQPVVSHTPEKKVCNPSPSEQAPLQTHVPAQPTVSHSQTQDSVSTS